MADGSARSALTLGSRSRRKDGVVRSVATPSTGMLVSAPTAIQPCLGDFSSAQALGYLRGNVNSPRLGAPKCHVTGKPRDVVIGFSEVNNDGCIPLVKDLVFLAFSSSLRTPGRISGIGIKEAQGRWSLDGKRYPLDPGAAGGVQNDEVGFPSGRRAGVERRYAVDADIDEVMPVA